MKAIKESILSSTNTGKDYINFEKGVDIAKKLYERLNKNVPKKYDMLGNKINIGDIVTLMDMSAGHNLLVYVIKEVESEKLDNDQVLCYDPIKHTDKNIDTYWLLKLNNPEKYLK